MPYYRVMLCGTGIEVVMDGMDPRRPIVGFYATRSVRAGSVEEAGYRAMELVRQAWNRPPWREHGQGGSLELAVESVGAHSWWRHLLFKNRGHVFFPRDEETAE